MEWKPVIEQCQGCDRIRTRDGSEELYCSAYKDPNVFWRHGNCPLATHVKVQEYEPRGKVRVGQQKQKKGL